MNIEITLPLASALSLALGSLLAAVWRVSSASAQIASIADLRAAISNAGVRVSELSEDHASRLAELKERVGLLESNLAHLAARVRECKEEHCGWDPEDTADTLAKVVTNAVETAIEHRIPTGTTSTVAVREYVKTHPKDPRRG